MKQQIPAEALAAWDRGDRTDAIRLLREETGVGLKEAHYALASGAFHVTTAAAQADQAAQALAPGRLLDALRAVQAQAKAAATAPAPAKLAPKAPPPSDLAPGEVPPSRGWGWLCLVALGLLAWAGYRGWVG